jgi:hypothetical protein
MSEAKTLENEWEIGPTLAVQRGGNWYCSRCGKECNYQASGHYDFRQDRWLCSPNPSTEPVK